MATIRILIAFFIIAISISSCDKCGSLECATNDIAGDIRIVSAASGSDVIFGANSVYNKDQIKFYSVKGIDTTYYSLYNTTYRGQGTDSVMRVSFFPKADVVYMRLSNGDVDTFTVTYSTFKSKCCGVFDEISSLMHNQLNVSVNKGLIELKK